MTAEEFRKMALSLPETSEAAHMGHPDFRVGGKIFATLSPPGLGWAMVKLTPEQQESFAQAEPSVFMPFNGAWGREGATKVQLRKAKKSTLRTALVLAWRNRAPKRLVQKFDVE
ncbi:MAG: MmcQ/YjbR family DNA-binding protein [Acidobacteriota bacterium]